MYIYYPLAFPFTVRQTAPHQSSNAHTCIKNIALRAVRAVLTNELSLSHNFIKSPVAKHRNNSPRSVDTYIEKTSQLSRLVILSARLADACQAFRAIDEKGTGYIETAKMSELLVTKGTPFRAKEIEAFLSIAKVQ